MFNKTDVRDLHSNILGNHFQAGMGNTVNIRFGLRQTHDLH